MIGKEVEDKLERQFRAAGFNFEREPAIGGLRPDFLVKGPNGEVVVIEAKTWDPKGGNTARALEQVNRYLEVTGADYAFLVLPDLKRTFWEKGVVSADTIVPALERLFQQPARLTRLKHSTPDRTDKTVFAAMPFTREYDDTYYSDVIRRREGWCSMQAH